MKKKILFVITKSNFGGAQKYVYDLATNLPKEQFDVMVATGGTGTLIQKLHDQNIRVIPIPSLTRDVNMASDVMSFIEMFKIIRREHPDVVHLNSAKASGVGAFVARIVGVQKIIFTAHGWAFNEERPSWQRLIITFFSWLTVMFSHRTIAVSDAVKNSTALWPLVQKKIVVVKNGIATPDFYSRELARKNLFTRINKEIPQDAYIIGTIAELHNNKGLAYAIEAFSKLVSQNPNIYYCILGGGEEYEFLNTLIKSKNLEKRVFLFGFTDNAARFLPAFESFVLPSITEGLALVLLEAGLAKLPVVASNVGGIPEIITDRGTGLLVPPRDPETISLALKKIITNPLIAKQLGDALYTHVLSHFSLDREIAETSSLYTRT